VRIFALLVLIIATPASVMASPSGWGHFPDPLELRMNRQGRSAELTSTFTYVDMAGKRWTAPKGAVVDGASIPKAVWSLIGGPWDGEYRDASVIHDYYCDRKSEPWRKVHEMFYHAMLANNVSPTKAKVMYAAVYRFGPRWNFVYTPKCANCAAVPYRVGEYERSFDRAEFDALRGAIESGRMSLEEVNADSDELLTRELSAKRAGKVLLIH
jgi:hypothetical protein